MNKGEELKIVITDVTEEQKDSDLIGDYDYKIIYDGKTIAGGSLKEVLKIRELNAIISCLAKDMNGDMFDDN